MTALPDAYWRMLWAYDLSCTTFQCQDCGVEVGPRNRSGLCRRCYVRRRQQQLEVRTYHVAYNRAWHRRRKEMAS